VNEGLVTSSSGIEARLAKIPFTSVVLPLPNSPSNNTKQGGWTSRANSRPKLTVSSGEWVTRWARILEESGIDRTSVTTDE
jgi:hypothetical protein